MSWVLVFMSLAIVFVLATVANVIIAIKSPSIRRERIKTAILTLVLTLVSAALGGASGSLFTSSPIFSTRARGGMEDSIQLSLL